MPSTTTTNRQSSLLVVVVVTATTVGLASVVWWRWYRPSSRRQEEPCFRPWFRIQDDDDDDQLTHRFHEAASLASSHLPQTLTNGDKLLLYGLYKQATVGDNNNNNNIPSRLQVVAYAKHTAWNKFVGMPQTTAMHYYIQAIQEFTAAAAASTRQNEDRYEEDMDGMAGGVELSSMGLRPSMPQQHNDDDDDNELIQETDLSWNDRLVRAASRNDWEGVQLALQQDTTTNVNASDDAGQTCLHFAADRGNVDMVIWLLQRQPPADVTAKDQDGIGVLQAAVIAGHVDVARVLLEHDADPDAQDGDGDTPRSCAQDDGSEAMKQLFVQS